MTFNAKPDWRHDAACRDVPLDLHFPTASEGTVAGDLARAEAKAVCHRCPVASSCLRFVLETGADRGEGVWGGLTESERRDLRRRLTEPTLEREEAIA